MTVTEDRKTWLDRILAPFQAKQARDQLEAKRRETREAAATLDAAGVVRKAQPDKSSDTDPYPDDQAEPAQPDDAELQNDPVLKVAQELTEQIKTAVQGDYSKLTDEGLISTLANVLREALPPDPIDREETDPEEVMTMDDTNIKKEQKPAELSETTKAITQTFETLVKENAEIAQAYIETQAEIKELKSLKPAVEELTKTVNALQAQLNQRPRIASEDQETVPTLSADAEKALKDAIEKGLNGPKKKFFNVPIIDEPK